MAEYAPYTVINVQSDETISHSLCRRVVSGSVGRPGCSI